MAATSTLVKIGPFGAQQGNRVDIPFPVPLKLNKLEVWNDDTKGIINGIQFTCTDNNQNPVPPKHFGKMTGNYNILFDTGAQGAGDYVVNLHGYADTNVVHKLGIKSQAGADNSCGAEIGKSFEIPVASGSIVAFFGLSDGRTLNAVGAYVVPRDAP